YGLIAEEVAEVFPELVVRNQQGEPETVKYHLLATLLLNELQKQQGVLQAQQLANQRQEAELSRIRHQQVELNALKEQLAELQNLVVGLAQH
ncbi:MAG: hypothetical protein ACR2P6_09370, partial [Gammaproteobacteria bacterium]